MSTIFNLRIGDKFIKIECKHDKRTQTTSVICGKRKEVRNGKKFNDRSIFPLFLVLPELQMKLNIDLDRDQREYTLEVNGRSMYALPYIHGK